MTNLETVKETSFRDYIRFTSVRVCSFQTYDTESVFHIVSVLPLLSQIVWTIMWSEINLFLSR